jgi:protocatechuate 3,4-dioxygenase, alpha subunit
MTDQAPARGKKLGQTPSQTVGPYFAYGLTGDQYGYRFASIASGRIAAEDEPGTHVRIVGRVLDGAGAAVEDALIEIWQADASGRYAHPADGRASNHGFRGFGRFGTGTDPQKRFLFDTVKPGSVDGVQASHLNVTVMMRGLLNHVFTRIYFPEDATANARCPVLTSVPAARRPTLIAERIELGSGLTYRFDIHMQGAAETVFFDV